MLLIYINMIFRKDTNTNNQGDLFFAKYFLPFDNHTKI